MRSALALLFLMHSLLLGDSMIKCMADMKSSEQGIIVNIKNTYSSSLYATLGIIVGNKVNCLYKDYYAINNITFVFNDGDKVEVKIKSHQL